jgi:hypothetical protein
MQSAPTTSPSPIPVPEIESEVPVAVIPTASVAPLDGEPTGERINVFTVAPKRSDRSSNDFGGDALGDMRQRVLDQPLTCAAVALSLGFVLGRMLR